MAPDSGVEKFEASRSYLVFLESDSAQVAFGSLYEIDASRAYYRAHRREGGVVRISGAETAGKRTDSGKAMLAAVTDLCDAVKPADSRPPDIPPA